MRKAITKVILDCDKAICQNKNVCSGSTACFALVQPTNKQRKTPEAATTTTTTAAVINKEDRKRKE